MFPQATGMAASFDEDLAYKVVDVISTEDRAVYHEFQIYIIVIARMINLLYNKSKVIDYPKEIRNLDERINIYDIAVMAKVSTTTVYKVIHGKKGVGEDTRRSILDIIEKYGYKTNTIAQTLARKTIKIGIVIENYSSEFNAEVFEGIKDTVEELADSNIKPIYGTMEGSFSKDRVINDLNRMIKENVDGVILFPYVPYREYTGVIDRLAEENIPVILATTDIPDSNRLMTISHNYRLVGELGAELLETFNPGGKNVLFIGSKDVIGHQEIIQGFASRLDLSGNEPVGVYETQDDETIGYHLTEKLLRDHPYVNGIFVGTSHSIGVCRKVVDARMIDKIKIVSVDTFPKIIEYIKQDVIKATIFQNPYLQGKMAVKKMAEYLVTRKIPEKQILINPRIVMKSNCMNYKD